MEIKYNIYMIMTSNEGELSYLSQKGCTMEEIKSALEQCEIDGKEIIEINIRRVREYNE